MSQQEQWTKEEIEGLSAGNQRRMATLALSGWRFARKDVYWWAGHATHHPHIQTAYTLPDLLHRIVVEDHA